MAPTQNIYIVSAIHCPAPEGINPHCYTITGAYATASAAQAAMLAKAKELQNAPMTHWHGSPKKGQKEWKESAYKVEFKGEEGDFGVCWVDERVLGVDEMPISRVMKVGLGMGHGEDKEEWVSDTEVEKSLCSLLKY